MKKTLTILVALAMMIGSVQALAGMAGTPNTPPLEAYIDITPDVRNVVPDGAVLLTMAADLEQRGADRAEFVSIGWAALNVTDPNSQVPLGLEILTAPEAGENDGVFVSTARLLLGEVPGVYEVQVTVTLTLDPRQGSLGSQEFTATETFTLTVLAPGTTLPPGDDSNEGSGFLNHGQVVSAWAQWKQGKDRDDFVPGGPGTQYSNVWYKAQVEYMDFATREEVWAYLDSIYVDLDADMDDGGGAVIGDDMDNDEDNFFGLFLDITPDLASVYQNQNVVLTLVGELDDDEDGYEIVGYEWVAFNVTDPNAQAPLTLNVLAGPGADGDGFISEAELLLGGVPGVYQVRVTFRVTLRHPGGTLADEVFTVTKDFTVTVLEGEADLDDAEGLLNHGQIVSAWAQWKQGRDKGDFAKGGPGVERSKVWYKTQVEYMEFDSREEVWAYLDSIFEPFDGDGNNGSRNNNRNNDNRNNDNRNNGKDKDNNGNNGNGNNGKNGNGNGNGN